MNNAVNYAPPGSRSERAGFAITVLFTSASETLHELHTAETLAADLGARVNLVNVQVVPYPLPLDRPPVYVEFLADQLRAVAEQSALPVEVHLYFGRDVADTLRSVLPAESILVTGSRSQARRLRRCGHQIVVADGDIRARVLPRLTPRTATLIHGANDASLTASSNRLEI